MITVKAGAPHCNRRFNRDHVSVLSAARNRWKTPVWLVNKWSFNPSDKPSLPLSGSPVSINAWLPCSIVVPAPHLAHKPAFPSRMQILSLVPVEWANASLTLKDISFHSSRIYSSWMTSGLEKLNGWMHEASSAREVTQRSHADYPNPNLNLQIGFALSFHCSWLVRGFHMIMMHNSQ